VVLPQGDQQAGKRAGLGGCATARHTPLLPDDMNKRLEAELNDRAHQQPPPCQLRLAVRQPPWLVILIGFTLGSTFIVAGVAVAFFISR
jgi:hypothetical protein